MTEKKKTALRVGVYFLAWLVMAVPVSFGLFLNAEKSVTVASHDAMISPALGNHVTIRTGPFLPNVRREARAPLGVDIVLGKTEAGTIEEAVERYAFIASQPDAQIKIVTDALVAMALESALRGGVVAIVPIGVWLLIGKTRRRQLFGATRWARVSRAGVAVVVASGLVVVLTQKSWLGDDAVVVDQSEWQSLPDYLPGVVMPPEARDIEIQGTLAASGTRRLVLSAIDTYDKSSTFYAEAKDNVDELELREPAEDETVAVLISDRHDNIGMDPVARAIGDRAGASVILDAGDDTSTGASWEAFSLDSLNEAFDEDDYARYSVQGNHDHGGFVGEYLADRGWTTATNAVIDAGPIGNLASWDDPRSSGLGNWRDQKGLSVEELSTVIADEICDGDERVNTLLVHDMNMADQTLARGCTDLVVAGHVHVVSGPTPFEGSNGEVGYRFRNGTSGGAAYAVAVGSKLRRAADVSLITYRDERPVGIQVVTLQTNGGFEVGEWTELDYQAPPEEPGEDEESPAPSPSVTP